MKRILVIGIILLFIGMSISSSTGFNAVEQLNIVTTNGKTLYVGGDGPGNYTKIQDAIDNASDGNTVFVYNGKYFENLIIDKSINLIGQGKNNTIIKSDYSTISVTINEVVICGFTIEANSYRESIRLQRSDNNKIYGNKILSDYVGIFLKFSDNNEIYRNEIQTSDTSLILGDSMKNEIHSNIIYENVFVTDSHHNQFYNNIFLKEDVGIIAIDSNNNSIVQNIFSNGSDIWLDNCYLNVFSHNNIFNTDVIFNYYYIRFALKFPNNWNYNYWGEPRILPKPIIGRIAIFGFWPYLLWLNFDWRPLLKPYDIEV